MTLTSHTHVVVYIVFREDGPPVELADLLSASNPWLDTLNMSVQMVANIKECDQCAVLVRHL